MRVMPCICLGSGHKLSMLPGICLGSGRKLSMLQALMVEPVIAADGYTFERDALEEWLQRNSTSAVTGDLLPHTRFVPNFLIKSAISANTTC